MELYLNENCVFAFVNCEAAMLSVSSVFMQKQTLLKEEKTLNLRVQNEEAERREIRNWWLIYVRIHIGGRVEQNISYKNVETSLQNREAGANTSWVKVDNTY